MKNASMSIAPRQARGGRPLLCLVLAALGSLDTWNFVTSGRTILHRSRSLMRSATETETEPATSLAETATDDAFMADDLDPVGKLCSKLPFVLGRGNCTEESLDFKVTSTKVGTSVKLVLPSLQGWQFVRGKGRLKRIRPLPNFTSTSDSLKGAKEAAAQSALSALFRTLVTRLSSRNNKQLSKVIAGIFNDDVEVAQIRFEGNLNETEKSPGNILFALAYLARETYPDDKKKRMLTASQVTTLPSAKTWNQVFVQQKLQLVMPQNVSVEKVSAETQPYKLATYIEKALREKGAVKLQVVGTKGAEQAFLALRNLKQIPHRFSSYFLRSDFQNATGLEVQVARKWRPI